MKKSILTTAAILSAFAFAQAQEITVSSDITSDTTWGDNESVVILDKPIFVKGGATLTIQKGTIVRGQPRSAAVSTGQVAGSPGALIVTRTGRIVAAGESNDPIIFTTAAVDNNNDGIADASGDYYDTYSAGDTYLDAQPALYPLAPLDASGNSNVGLWGGMVILGSAPINALGAQTTASNDTDYGTVQVEGLITPGFAAADVTFGGVVPSDSSGSLEYVSIRHAGDEIGESNELNGLTLGGVGYGTKLENIEIYCNFDDGFEWFGGTVFGKNLVATFIGDDSFDIDHGYTGMNQNLFAVLPFFKENDGTNFGSKSGDKGCEWDGDDASQSNGVIIRSNESGLILDDTASPLSGPVVFNMTILGSAPEEDALDNDSTIDFTATAQRGGVLGMRMRHGFAGFLVNSLILNTGTKKGIEIKNDNEGSAANSSVEQNVNNGALAVLTTSFYQTNVDASGVAATTFGTTEESALAAGDALTLAKTSSTQVINYRNVSFNAAGAVINDDTTFNPQGATGVSSNSAAGVLSGALKATKLDPRPINALATLRTTEPFGPGIEATSARGAFTSSTSTELWTKGWTALSIGGIMAD